MKKLLCILSLIPFGFFSNCGSQEQPNGGKAGVSSPQKISAVQAKAIMDEGKPYTLLDVRTEDEYKEGHIRGAVLIPVDELQTHAEKELPDKNAFILVYCRSGARSARAAKTLAGMGYTGIHDFGGIIDWPYETVKN